MSEAGEHTRSSRRRVVVTGFGPITASGIGKEAFWDGVRGEASPIREIDRFDPGPFNCRIAAQVDDFDPLSAMDATQARRLDRFGHFSIASATLALDDAGLDPDSVDPDRVAVQMGTALGGVAYGEEQYGRFLSKGVRGVNPRLALMVFGGAASCNVAIHFGFTGPNSTNAMSCASGTMAVGDGWRCIRSGAADVALVGGIEAPLSQLSFGAFAIIRAMSTRNDDPTSACRPFDSGRDGFVMGEGAGALVLESLDHALRRGARIYAEIVGYGNSNDAHHMTAPRPDGSQAARAITMALQSGDVRPDEIDYVNAHASSTPLNDSTESKAIERALGSRAREIPVSGTKPYYGHALGASGAIEVGICGLVFANDWIPPTLNHEAPGEGCGLDYVPNHGRGARIDTILSNSFGFGGINASLVLRRFVDGSSGAA